MRVKHTLNGFSLQDNGIFVEETIGLFDLPKRKEVPKYSWFESDGHVPDLSVSTHVAREIILDCWIKGENWYEVIRKFKLFEYQISRGMFRMQIDFLLEANQTVIVPRRPPTSIQLNPNISLSVAQRTDNGYEPWICEVYCEDDIRLKKKFHNNVTYGTFQVKLIEPKVFKKLFRTSAQIVDFSCDPSASYVVYWGDGTSSKFVNSVGGQHVYEEGWLRKRKYVLVYGDKTYLRQSALLSNSRVSWIH